MIDDNLQQFATIRQWEYYTKSIELGSNRQAAKFFDVSSAVVDSSISALKRKAASRGHSPDHDMTKIAPDPFIVRGASTYYNSEGKVSGQWIKTKIDDSKLEEIIRTFVIDLAEDIKGLAPITPPPPQTSENILTVIPMGDPHFGLYAWAKDAGDDFDLGLAEQLTCSAIDRLIASAPNSDEVILLNLGDMFHADNQMNVSKSGHQLDVDGRWPKVQQVGLRATIYCLKRLLEKHKKVLFRINKGNHDGHSSYALALMISCYFHNEPRMEVDLSPAVCWYYQFGKVLIGTTHGDTIKGKDMLSIMAADKAEEWGKSKFRYWYVGHVHHKDVKEYHGGVVEYFRTLAARDAWHQGQGYRAGRDMCAIILHKEHGEIERHTCDIGRLHDRRAVSRT